jgi:hypothetical protein
VEHAKQCGVGERHACQLVHQPRGTQRYQPTQRNDEDALPRAIIALASQYGRYGYRSYDFVSTFTHDGRTVRMLNLIDEYTPECLAIHVQNNDEQVR